jgi:hypothetical protein
MLPPSNGNFLTAKLSSKKGKRKRKRAAENEDANEEPSEAPAQAAPTTDEYFERLVQEIEESELPDGVSVRKYNVGGEGEFLGLMSVEVDPSNWKGHPVQKSLEVHANGSYTLGVRSGGDPDAWYDVFSYSPQCTRSSVRAVTRRVRLWCV